MANILFIDPGEVAVRAMQGILGKANHRVVSCAEAAQARVILRNVVKIDLIITEMKLDGETGLGLLQRLRDDIFLKNIPVLFYCSTADMTLVKKAIALKIQNFLTKPFHDDIIYREITKACANPWRNLHFEEDRSFCATMGFSTHDLRRMREELMQTIQNEIPFFTSCATDRSNAEAYRRIDRLSEQSEAAGYWGLVDYLKWMRQSATDNNWAVFAHCDLDLEYARQLIFYQLNPNFIPEGLITTDEKNAELEAKETKFWMEADVDLGGALVRPSEVTQKLEALAGCPVMSTTAANFQMAANGSAASLNHLMDMTMKDPGLTAQVLVAANKLPREDMIQIEDPRIAISLLGELKLKALAKQFPMVDARRMHFPPVTWEHSWLFQVAVAKLAEYVCKYLEFRSLEAMAYTGGLLHDIGKLILLGIYPFSAQAIIEHSRIRNVSASVAERKYIGFSARELGVEFAQKFGIPAPYLAVIRWVETPEKATEHHELVAAVSFARMLCMHNHVGYCGELPKDKAPPIEESPAWLVLQNKVFMNFNLREFEAKAHAECDAIRQNLTGKMK